jgi:hypothetical protein
MPTLQLPSRERLALLWNRFITITLWAVALTYTAGRLARIGFEWARPFIAKALHALAIALDGGLLFPDQPEPDPTPDPGDSAEARFTNPVTGGVYALGTPAADKPQRMAAGELIASSKPRAARRRTTQISPEAA